MLLNIILLIIGFIILIKGADIFVDGASSIAQHYKVPKMLIGLTIVAFGTSAPEFAISMKSIISGNGEIILGNVIGSNTLNILLILGIASMNHNLKVKENTIKQEIPFTLLMTAAFTVLISDSVFGEIPNTLTRGDGIIIIMFFLIFIYYLFKVMASRQYKEAVEPKFDIKKSIVYTILGIIAIIFGSNLVVNKSSEIAAIMGISERIIGLTIVALGTSLPELITSVIATKKGEYDIAIGNVVGSNIFNIGLVLGVPVILFGTVKMGTFNYIDLIVMLLSVIMLYIFSKKDGQIDKKEGIIFLVTFIIYYAFVII